MVSSLLVISTVMADLLCAMVPMSFHLSHTQELNIPTRLHHESTAKIKGNLLVEHDGPAISVFDKHSNKRHSNKNVVGVVVL